MDILTMDAETFFSDEFSLKKLTTEEYCRSPQFEVHGWGIRWGDGRLEWLTHEEAVRRFATIDWTRTAVLGHHLQFDGFILNHTYGIRPAFLLDSLSMARLVVGNHLSVSLDALAKHYGLPAKDVPYNLFKGRHWHELDASAQQRIADGCLHDVELTWRLFNILMQSFPDEELRVVDMTVRMFTEPVLQGDIPLLAKVWMDEEAKKQTQLAELGVDREDLQSADKFAALLQAEGVDPAVKPSPTGNGDIYAFAKTDEFMKDLIEEDSRAGALARARLGVRSTITQTRAGRLGYMATRGALPVYLRYSGAHTTRWSGGDQINWQNFPRGGSIRRSIRSPEGHMLIILDLAQVECRLLNALAGQTDVLDKFREGRDVYSEAATQFYGRTITKTDKLERFMFKGIELGCGFGMGPPRLRITFKRGTPSVDIDDAQSASMIQFYRATHPLVVAYWQTASRMIARLAGGPPLEWGPMEIRDGKVYLPNGAWLNYTTLEYDRDWQAWKIKNRQGWTKLYGGKLVENVVQALARVVLSQAMLRIAAKGYRIVTCTHDEIVVVVPRDGREQAAFDECKAEMERSPAWLPELPVKAEGGISDRYEK